MLTSAVARRASFLMVFSGLLAGPFHADLKAEDKCVPRELSMRSLPDYRIGPPDILQIELISSKDASVSGGQSSVKPKAGVPRLTANVGDSTSVNRLTIVGDAGGPGMTKSGAGTWVLSGNATNTGGTVVNSGKIPFNYNFGLTTDTATGVTVRSLVAEKSSDGTFRVGGGGGVLIASSKAQPGVPKSKAAGLQAINAQYLVGPDGTINLRRYGKIQVMGKTIAEARAAVEKRLKKYVDSPEVAIDVIAYNSKVYYVITEGAGLGDTVRRLPITGNDTVLDALCAVGGLSQVSSTRMWIARPSASNSKKGTILPIDYEAITRRGATATNYQLMPGDRLFIAQDRAVALNNKLVKVTTPVERVLGLISLGAATVEHVEKLLSDDKDDEDPE